MVTSSSANTLRRYKSEFRRDVRGLLTVSQNHMNTVRTRKAAGELERSRAGGMHRMVLTDAEGNDIWRGDTDGFEGDEEEDDEIVYEDEDADEVLTAAEFRTQRQVAHAKELLQIRQEEKAKIAAAATGAGAVRSKNQNQEQGATPACRTVAWHAQTKTPAWAPEPVRSEVELEADARTARQEGFFLALAEYESATMRSMSTRGAQEQAEKDTDKDKEKERQEEKGKGAGKKQKQGPTKSKPQQHEDEDEGEGGCACGAVR